MRNLPLAMGSLTLLILAAALLVTVVSSDAAGTNADAFRIDMDPGTIAAPTNMVPESGGQCGNATDDDADVVADDGCDPWNQGGVDPLGMGFGTIQTCARINENGITDADEESIDTAIINIVADNIPQDHPMFAFAFTLSYDATRLRVTEKQMTGSTPPTHQMINAFPGSAGLDASDIPPDKDGAFSAAVADVTADVPSSEYGDGSLGRLNLQSLDTATSANTVQLTLTAAVHQEPLTGTFRTPDALGGATLALNTACAGGATTPPGTTPATGPTPTPSPTPTPTPSPTPTTPPNATSGDIDCDGTVDSVDALIDLRSVAGLPLNLPPGCAFDGDVDCDTDADSVDALRILRYVSGLPNNLPPGCPEIGSG
jgi:hypothetical protein